MWEKRYLYEVPISLPLGIYTQKDTGHMVFLFLISLETTILLSKIITLINILKVCKDALFFTFSPTLVTDTAFEMVTILRSKKYHYGLTSQA